MPLLRADVVEPWANFGGGPSSGSPTGRRRTPACPAHLAATVLGDPQIPHHTLIANYT